MIVIKRKAQPACGELDTFNLGVRDTFDSSRGDQGLGKLLKKRSSVRCLRTKRGLSGKGCFRKEDGAH